MPSSDLHDLPGRPRPGDPPRFWVTFYAEQGRVAQVAVEADASDTALHRAPRPDRFWTYAIAEEIPQ